MVLFLIHLSRSFYFFWPIRRFPSRRILLPCLASLFVGLEEMEISFQVMSVEFYVGNIFDAVKKGIIGIRREFYCLVRRSLSS